MQKEEGVHTNTVAVRLADVVEVVDGVGVLLAGAGGVQTLLGGRGSADGSDVSGLLLLVNASKDTGLNRVLSQLGTSRICMRGV